ncbi:MAG: hypothetical protein V4516_00395 [Pseudomonadota bacterium]
MEPKLIVPTLLGLGAAFFFLSGNQSFEMPNLGLGLGMVTDMNGNVVGAVNAKTPVLQAGGEPVAMGDLVDGIVSGAITAAPAELRLIKMTEGCSITRPAAGQRVAAVMAKPADLRSQIYSYDEDEFARAAAYDLQRVLGQGNADLARLKRLNVGPMTDLSLSVVNVIVPPGPDPVYLVLKDQFGGILWNILPMPGAKVEQVALLSVRSGGVVNLPEGAYLQVPDLRGGDCGAFARVIEDPAVTEAAGFVLSDETRAQWAAYSAWFTDTFGIPADTGLNGRDGAYAILAGAAPPPGSPKAVWAGVEGRIAHVIPTDILYASGEKQHEDWFTAKAEAEIARAFGVAEGSDLLALVKPAIHERTN